MREALTDGSINFPEFKYYKLDRDHMAIKDGAPALVKDPPRTRAMHMDILQAVFPLLKGDATEQQRWKNAMLWSWFNWLPEYFFTAPASSTHKYHPSWANRPDGLLLHSLAVCRCAANLMDLFPAMQEDAAQNNRIIFACWHHDMFKYGELGQYAEGEYTTHEHPVHAADFFRLDGVRRILAGEAFRVKPEECDEVAQLIQSHSGPYRNSSRTDFKLPECATTKQKLVYKADWFASRKENALVQDVLAEIPMEC